MIRHTVIFILKGSAKEVEINRAFSLLKQLRGNLPGFIRVACGECTLHGVDSDNKRIYGFSIDFENEDACNAFLTDPVTNPAKGAILNIVEGEMSGLYGFDVGKSFGPTYNPSPLDRYRIPVPRLLPRGMR